MKLIEFYGGPGSGKSTLAAACYAACAMKSNNAFLVTEFIKDFANRNIEVKPEDGLWILGNQTRVESQSYGKYDYVFTDSPLFLANYYMHYYTGGNLDIYRTIRDYEQYVDKEYGIQRIRIFVPLIEEYFNQAGRYQDYAESELIAENMRRYLHYVCNADYTELNQKTVDAVAGIVGF